MTLNVGGNFYQHYLAILKTYSVGKDLLQNPETYHNKPLRNMEDMRRVMSHKKLIKPKILHREKLTKQNNILKIKLKMLNKQ